MLVAWANADCIRGGAGHCGVASDIRNFGGHAAAFRDLANRGKNVGNGGVVGSIVAGAHIERQFATARYDVDDAVRHHKLAHSADQIWAFRTASFDRKNNFSRGGGRIVTKRHRNGARRARRRHEQ